MKKIMFICIAISAFVYAQNPFKAPPISQSLKQTYLEAINDVRTQRQHCGRYGIKPAARALKWSDELYKAALEHSNDMAASGNFSHKGSGKKTDWTCKIVGKQSNVKDRVINNGYEKCGSIGENIAAGTSQDSAAKAIQMWLRSPEHCAILMNPAYKKAGMAMSQNRQSKYIYYWTQVFSDH
jgi:uncharacterized protein YkwD